MLGVSARFVALLGLRRPEQREPPQWPVRLHQCDGGAIKAPDGGGYGARGERGAGTGAPVSLLDRLPPRPAAPCVFPPWKPFLFFM